MYYNKVNLDHLDYLRYSYFFKHNIIIERIKNMFILILVFYYEL